MQPNNICCSIIHVTFLWHQTQLLVSSETITYLLFKTTQTIKQTVLAVVFRVKKKSVHGKQQIFKTWTYIQVMCSELAFHLSRFYVSNIVILHLQIQSLSM